MAYDKDHQEFPLPTGSNNSDRKSAEFLPKYFRTPVNNKFLHSTLDQLISQGKLEKINLWENCPLEKSDFNVLDIHPNVKGYKKIKSCISKNNDINNFIKF